MLRIAASALGGVMLLQQLPRLPGAAWAVPMLILALPLSASRARCWVLPGLAGFAWAWWVAATTLQGRLADRLHGQDVRLVGYVASFVSGDARRVTFSFQVVPQWRSQALPARWRLSWYRPAHELLPGQDLEVVVRARQARSLGNPASFDYQGWLFRERLGGTGYVRDLAVRPGGKPGPGQWWLRQRARLYARLRDALPGRAGALFGALAVGARHDFSTRDWSVLRRTGTSHLVAISGLHVGLVGLGAFAVVRALLLRVPWTVLNLQAGDLAAGVALAAAAGYAALAGFGLPAQRALVMLLVAAVGFVSRRRWGRGDALAVALLAVLSVDPLGVMSPGFWLSFGAVGTLLVALNGRPLAARDPLPPGPGAGVRQWFAGLVRAQWAVALGLGPLLLFHFGELALLAPVINLFAVPWFSCVLVPATLATTLLSSFWPALAQWLLAGLAPLMEGTWWLLSALAAQPWASAAWPARPVPLVILGAAGMAAFYLGRGLPGHSLWLTLLLPVLTWRVPSLSPGHLRLSVLDVGQGLAAVVETRTHVLVYDAGPGPPGGFDAGASVVVPALRRLGWGAVDRLVIGHGDLDHAGGAGALLEAFPGTAVVAGPDVDIEPSAGRCRAGQSWEWDGVRFNFLHPPATGRRADNDGSCVLRIETAAAVALLTGDIEKAAETELVNRRAQIAADVVVVPHHGSSTSSTAAFVAAVSPRLAVVPAGFRNRWGLPDAAVVARWRAAGARVLTTGEVGGVAVVLGTAGVEVQRLGRRTRYWHTL